MQNILLRCSPKLWKAEIRHIDNGMDVKTVCQFTNKPPFGYVHFDKKEGNVLTFITVKRR